MSGIFQSPPHCQVHHNRPQSNSEVQKKQQAQARIPIQIERHLYLRPLQLQRLPLRWMWIPSICRSRWGTASLSRPTCTYLQRLSVIFSSFFCGWTESVSCFAYQIHSNIHTPCSIPYHLSIQSRSDQGVYCNRIRLLPTNDPA